MALNRIDPRIRIKRSTISGLTPTVGVSSDYTDGSWTATTEIYPAEFFMNMPDERLWIGTANGVAEIDLISSGGTDFDFCATGIKTSAISGCSPISILSEVQGKDATATGDYAFCWGSGSTVNGVYGAILGGLGNSTNDISGSVFGSTFCDSEDTLSCVIGSQYSISNGYNSTIMASRDSLLDGCEYSAIIGGNGITGTSNSTVYVPNLNVDTLPNQADGADNYNFLVRAASGEVKRVSGYTGTVATAGGDLIIVNGLITSVV